MTKNKSGSGEQAKTEIKQAFWRLLREKPTARITVKELCCRAGYSRYTFYQYYQDIYDVLRQVEEDVLRETDRAYLSILPDIELEHRFPTVDEMERVQAETMDMLQTALPILFGKNGDPGFHNMLRDHFIVYLRAYYADCFRERNFENDLMAEFFTSGFIAALEFLGKKSDTHTFKEMMEVIYNWFGIAPEGKLKGDLRVNGTVKNDQNENGIESQV